MLSHLLFIILLIFFLDSISKLFFASVGAENVGVFKLAYQALLKAINIFPPQSRLLCLFFFAQAFGLGLAGKGVDPINLFLSQPRHILLKNTARLTAARYFKIYFA